jgi:23S rRNA pseudouridine1911/1915/1917 synthase
MAVVEATCTISVEERGRADQCVARLTGRSRADVRGLFHHGCVHFNGTLCAEPGQMLQAGDVVLVRHDPHRRYREPPRERSSSAFRIVFEDDVLIVVEKPAGLLTVPTEHGERHTLQSAVDQHVRRGRRGAHAEIIHRLDRETSGLLVFAKDSRTARVLKEQFRIRKAEREYLAIVAGRPAAQQGTFETRLATTKSLQRYSVDAGEQGEVAITHYTVEQTWSDASLVRARLETGRRNQIRVHFAEAGHPVLGDDRYEPELARHPLWSHSRLALHAATLGFEHPRTGKPLRCACVPPPEMTRFIEAAAKRV